QRDATSRRRPRWIHLLERTHKRGKVARGLDCVDLLDGHGFALEPRVDIPEPGSAGRRAPMRDRNGYLEGEQRSQPRQPVVLLAPRLCRPVTTGEPHRQLVTETKDRV